MYTAAYFTVFNRIVRKLSCHRSTLLTLNSNEIHAIMIRFGTAEQLDCPLIVLQNELIQACNKLKYLNQQCLGQRRGQRVWYTMKVV